MNMRVVMKTLVLCALMIAGVPAVAKTNHELNPPTAESRAIHLQHRLEEINTIDRTSLSRPEKRMLRREVREIKKELAAISGGVYLSVGAIILIALLLILLL